MSLRERAQPARANLSLGTLGQLAQAAVAAGIAWELALQLPDHGQPFFAPIAAAIALGAERGTRGRQAIRMMIGVASASSSAPPCSQSPAQEDGSSWWALPSRSSSPPPPVLRRWCGTRPPRRRS
jgi:hypothetical protein